MEAFYALDQHSYEPARVESALRPLLEHDDFGVVYLVNGDQGYGVITWGYSLESGVRKALVDEIYLVNEGGVLARKSCRHFLATCEVVAS